jgi:hypothetical protein
MFEAIDLLAGAAIAGAGYLLGRLQRKPRAVLFKEPESICGCEHHYSFHDEAGCHFQYFDHDTERNLHCTCKKYVGPEPLPTVIP